MELKMNPNAVNQISKGTIIYTEGQPVTSIGMIVKGRIMIYNDGAKVVAGSGSFLGLNDLYLGRYNSTYMAGDDLLLYVFPINRIEEIEAILNVNKDYHGFMVASYYKLINDLDQIYQGLIKNREALSQYLTDSYMKYQAMASRRGFKARTSERFTQLELAETDLELISDRIRYYTECRSLPLEVVKTFYSYGNAITQYQVEDQVNIVNQQMETLKDLAAEYISLAECLFDDSETCLYRMIAEMSISMDNTTGAGNEIMELLDDIKEQVNQAEVFTERYLGLRFKADRKKLEEIYQLLLSENKGSEVSSETMLKYSKEDTQNALEEMKDSFVKLLAYAGIEGSLAEEMNTAMQDFVHVKDKTSADDHVRSMRRKIADNHYKIYFPMFMRAVKEKKPPRIVDMFLKYGFADEKLLTNDQLLSIYFLKEDEKNLSQVGIYNIKTWLTMIYEGRKEPSKNEFDLEYHENVTSLRKQNQITEKEAQQRLTDQKKKVEYEVQNMFRMNNRTVNGQITSFVPVLHKDMWSSNIEKFYVTPGKIVETMEAIMKIDYSVFDRELLYTNQEKNIVKEYIIKRVYPDIVLMPTIGLNGIMWQEISGKRRDTPARFLLPSFTEINLKVLLTKVFGRYRWELCRTIEGAAWNDIQHKSLTSEYSDYLQFYRKNKELSEEKKERIKLQIQKGRNNNREIFVIDYEQWIHYEASGAMKLNKPVREMMATYCPFAKEIRDQIKLQPAFEEAMARFYREKQKKVREIEGRYRMLQKDNIEITQELADTLTYHKET